MTSRAEPSPCVIAALVLPQIRYQIEELLAPEGRAAGVAKRAADAADARAWARTKALLATGAAVAIMGAVYRFVV